MAPDIRAARCGMRLQAAERFRVGRDESRQSLLDRIGAVAAEFEVEASGEAQLPRVARRQDDGGDGPVLARFAQRREQFGEAPVAPRYLALGACRPGEQRQRLLAGFVHGRREGLAESVHQARVAPARQGDVLFELHLDPVGPYPPQVDAAHPAHLLEAAARRGEVDGEEIAADAVHRVGDFLAAGVLQLAAHHDFPEREQGRAQQQLQPRVGEQQRGQAEQQVRRRIQQARVIPHGSLPLCACRGLRS
jgi:hypothetical protein